MAADEGRGNQQLNADEQKEKSSPMLAGMFGKIESVSSKQEGESGEDKQKDPHGRNLVLKIVTKGEYAGYGRRSTRGCPQWQKEEELPAICIELH
jgi:hypothetical protein